MNKNKIIKNLLEEFKNGDKFRFDSNNMQNIEDHLDKLMTQMKKLYLADQDNPATKKLCADFTEAPQNFSFAVEEDDECTKSYADIDSGTMSDQEIEDLRSCIEDMEANVRSYLSEVTQVIKYSRRDADSIQKQYQLEEKSNLK